MKSIGSVMQVRRGSLASPALAVAPLLLLAAACGSGIENTSSSKTPSDSAALSSSSKLPTQYSYEFFDAPGAIATFVFGINDSGDTVGMYRDAKGVKHAFKRKMGVTMSFDPPGSTSTYLGGINDLGTAVGWFTDGSGIQHGFKLAANMSFTVLDFPGATHTAVTSINNRGEIVGGYGPTIDEGVGFLLRNGHFTPLPDPPGAEPYANAPFGINDLGTISGYFADAAGTLHGFVLSGTRYTQLDAPNGGSFTAAQTINDLGIAVGDNDVGAFLVDTKSGVFSPFSCPNGLPTAPNGINNRGQVAGGCFTDPDGLTHGFIATPVRSDE